MSRIAMVLLHQDCQRVEGASPPKMQVMPEQDGTLTVTCPVCGVTWVATFVPKE